MAIIPYIIEQTSRGDRNSDLFSRMLMDRIIFLEGPIYSEMATAIVAQLLYLDSINNNDITIYISSGGGDIVSGLSIISTMDHVKSDISTVCLSRSYSMGSVILSAGKRGKRYITKYGSVLCHQPRTHHVSGTATNIELYTEELLRDKRKLTTILSDNCGIPYEEMLTLMEVDKYLDANESLAIGIIDAIL